MSKSREMWLTRWMLSACLEPMYCVPMSCLWGLRFAPWNESSVKGCKRFLERVVICVILLVEKVLPNLETAFHKTIKKVSNDFEEMKFNTAIATLMGLINEIFDHGSLTKDELITFIKLLCPVAPHLCGNLGEVWW